MAEVSQQCSDYIAQNYSHFIDIWNSVSPLELALNSVVLLLSTLLLCLNPKARRMKETCLIITFLLLSAAFRLPVLIINIRIPFLQIRNQPHFELDQYVLYYCLLFSLIAQAAADFYLPLVYIGKVVFLYYPKATIICIYLMWALFISTMVLLSGLFAWLCEIQVHSDKPAWQSWLEAY